MNDLKDLLGARLFLLDMDGTLYLGDDVFPGAVDSSIRWPRPGGSTST